MNEIDGLLEWLKELRKRLEKYSNSSLKEAQTRLILIDPTLKALGWDVSNPDQVDVEHGTVDGKAVDYALKVNGRVVLLVEAKSMSDPLTDVKAITQVVGYASNEGVDWCVLTNGSMYRTYRSTEKAAAPDKLLFEVSIGPAAYSAVSVDQIAQELKRLSPQSMKDHVLDKLADQIFSRNKVVKALESVFSDPPPNLVGMVMDAIEDDSVGRPQVKEAMKHLWHEWRESNSSNRTRPYPGLSLSVSDRDKELKPAAGEKEKIVTGNQKQTRQLKVKHPPVKSIDGTILAPSIMIFARNHNPQLKYQGMRTAIDVLTACKSPTGDDYNFHYDVDYRQDGVYVERKPGQGYRTLQREVDDMQTRAGLK